ncbi:MAG: Resolvase-like protein [Parcubacteria group bacterium GW2011_GWF2_50_9]|nr:MAG: Resolvase-like protein [Parcubacteria group bacterium GW2011_GWF2_50_9]
MTNKALLYVRVSSKEQEDGYSLDAQEKLGHNYARVNKLEIVKKWRISESAWGKKERRAFDQMIDYAKKHLEIGHIIFDITDRMTRNDFDKMKIYDLAKQHDKKIHFSRSNKIFDKNSNSDEEFMFDIEVAVAKKLSNDISRKSKMGMLEKAEQGWLPTLAPLGYKNNHETAEIDIDKARSRFVIRAFQLIASGSYSLTMAQEKLDEEGLRTRRGKQIPRNTLYELIRNPFYYGVFSWKGKTYTGKHAPIVSKDLFDKANKALKEDGRPWENKRNFAFSNLMRCGVCGCKVLGEIHKGRYIYYHCTFTKGRHQDANYIPEEKITEMFGPIVQKVSLPVKLADWLKEELKERFRLDSKVTTDGAKALKTEYDSVYKQLSNLYELASGGITNKEVFQAKEREYSARLADLKIKIANAATNPAEAIKEVNETLELTKGVAELYQKAKAHDKAEILRAIGSGYSFDGKKVVPTYRAPFDLIAASCPKTTGNWRSSNIEIWGG